MRTFTTLLICTIIFLGHVQAQPEIGFTQVGSSYSQPVDITGSGDGSGRLFIVEKRGTIKIQDGPNQLPDFFLNIQSQVMNSGERGLLGLAFHPEFPDSPYFYVNYVIINTIINRISRFTVNPSNENDALENSELILLEQAGVQSNHKAGDLAFGPDGYLYIGMGDGGGGGDPADAGQDIETFLGKILRIDVNTTTGNLNYGIPPTNPFVNEDGLDEIWAYGIRNPWRISFDRETGDFWIADVGQNQWEEINYIPAGTPGGLNFGWNCYEGTHDYEPQHCNGNNDLEDPIFEYPHNCNPCPDGQGASLTGGFVYRGTQYPLLEGWYIAVDYISNYVWLIQPDAGGGDPDVIVVPPGGPIDDMVAFGEADNGELYAACLCGTIYHVTEESSLPLQWSEMDATRIATGNRIDWTIHQTLNVDHFEIDRSPTADFASFVSLGHVLPVDGQLNYSYTDLYNQHLGVYYRVAAHLQDGGKEYSPVARLLPDPLAIPALVFDAGLNRWRVSLPDIWQTGEMTILDLQGKEVYKRKLSKDKMIELGPPIIPGCYFIQVKTDTDTWSEKVVL